MSNYKQLDISTQIYLSYRKYIKEHCGYEIDIWNKAPQNLTKFPTIILKEAVNINESSTTNRQEFIDRISYTVDIYTKDKTFGNTRYSSVQIMNELKYLTFDFFNDIGMDREACDDAEFLDITVDRKIMIFSCFLSSWNRKII